MQLSTVEWIWKRPTREAPPLFGMTHSGLHILQFVVLSMFAALLIACMFWFGIVHGMNKVLPNPLTSRTTQIGAAISDTAYGLDLKHAAHAKVVDFLLNNGMSDSPEILGRLGLKFPEITHRADVHNDIIARATHLDGISSDISLAKGTLAFTKMEDLGIIDFYKLSFRLFGYNIEGFYNNYFVLLIFSIVIIFVAFWDRIGILCIIDIILVGELFAIEYINYHWANVDLLTVHSGRFLSVLGIIPAFHLLALLWRPPRFRLSSLLLVGVQVFFLAYVISARSSTNWVTILWIGSALVLILWAGIKSWSTQPLCLFCRRILTWPLLASIAFAVASDTFIKSQTDASYYLLDELLPTHYTWHSLIAGLGAGDGYGAPSLDDVAPEYKGARSDPLGSAAAEAFMNRLTGFRFLEYFPSNILPLYGRQKSYERINRAEYIRFMEKHPRFWLRLTFVFKPQIMAQLTWHAFTGILRQDKWTWIILLITTLAIIVVFQPSSNQRSDFLLGTAILAAMTAAAMLPTLAAYPAVHTFGDIFAVICSFAFALAVGLLQKIVDLSLATLAASGN
jgi:hypothetical protein